MTDFWEQLARAPLREPLHIATDPDGVEVFLSREQWENHILVKHQQILSFRDYILPALTHPDERIRVPPFSEDRYTLRFHYAIPASVPPVRITRRRLRVVVKYLKPPAQQNRLAGLISTAYLMSWRGE